MNRRGQLSTKIFRWLLILLTSLTTAYLAVSLFQNTVYSKTEILAQSQPQIKQKFSYWIDNAPFSSAKQAISDGNNYVVSDPLSIPFDLGGDVYWIKLTLDNPALVPYELVLFFDNAMLEQREVYQLEGDELSLIEHAQVGLTENIFSHSNIRLLAKTEQTYLIKLQAQGPPNIPIVLFEKHAFEQRAWLTTLLYGGFIAIILVMAVYNLVLFSAIKDKVYLLYVGYLLLSCIVLGSVVGFGYLIFSESTQQFINRHSLFFHYYLVIFLLLFSVFFLRFDKTKGRLYWLSLVLTAFLVVTSCISLTLSHETQVKLFFGLLPFCYLLIFVFIGQRLKPTYAWARFYFLSWFPLLIGASVQPLVLLNHIEYSFVTRNAYMFGVLIEVVFMAFALAERMRRFEIERIREVSYHSDTGIPRKILLEGAISELSTEVDKRFSVVVIEPEQIHQIALYVDDSQKSHLLKTIYKGLSPLFAYNDAIVPIGENNEKIALLSGNRLAIIVDHKYSQQSMELLVNSIQQIVEEAYNLGGLKLPLAAIIGAANFPEHGKTGYVLLNRAQLAIEQANAKYKKWAYFEEEQADSAGYYLTLASDMNDAIEHGNFELYHQPQIDLKTMKVCGSEVLLRWNHPEKGFIPPAVFIPVAEDMGLINRITHWVIEHALINQQQLIELGYNHMVSINISGKDVTADGFETFVTSIIEKHEVQANKLVFELTESATITNNETALKVISTLSDLGVTISIDDFGTGYSSLAYITELPFNELKVDRQFVENVQLDQKRKVIAETTVKMAKGLGLEVVAEGINSQSDEDTLREFGCDIGQGYYYAKPMPLNEYTAWLEKENNGRLSEEDVIAAEGEYIPKFSE